MSYGQEEESVSGDVEEEEEEKSVYVGKEEELICSLSHPAHPHTLSGRAGTEPPAGCFARLLQAPDYIQCSVCSRTFNGFRYICSEDICEDVNKKKFHVDVGCILVPDFFTHKSHEHPLFILIYAGYQRENSIHCKGCDLVCLNHYLQCTLCEFAICYSCPTIPDRLHYKYDALPLSLCYGEFSDETYWWEVCEEELDPRKWFYTCTKTYVTTHHICVFGFSAYLKPGSTFHHEYFGVVEVLCNSSNTRPICHRCGSHCSSSVYYKMSDEKVICSLSCFLDMHYWEVNMLETFNLDSFGQN